MWLTLVHPSKPFDAMYIFIYGCCFLSVWVLFGSEFHCFCTGSVFSVLSFFFLSLPSVLCFIRLLDSFRCCLAASWFF